MDEIDTPGHGSRKTDAVICPVDIVIHGFRDSHYGEAFFMNPLSIAERIVTANGNQEIDTQVFEVAEDMLGEIIEFILFCLASEKLWCRLILYFPRIRSRGMEIGAAGAINGTNLSSVQLDNVLSL